MKLLREKTIGDILHVNANFGKDLKGLERITKRTEGGGCLLDIGIYTLNAVSMVYNGEKPEKIAAVGHLNDDGIFFNPIYIFIYLYDVNKHAIYI